MPVAAFLKELQASGRSEATQRSYGHDLLRWLRFLWAVHVPWDQATRVEARDFCRWLQIGSKPVSVRWKRSDLPPSAASGGKYAPRTAAHGESVLRAFYDFHVDTGAGPMLNPFPLVRERRRKRVGAHHNPMQPHRDERVGLYRPSWSTGRRAASRMRSSMSCSPGWARIAIGRWSLSSSRPVPGPRSCWACAAAMWMPVAADHGDPQGQPGGAAASGLAGCVRVASAVSGGISRTDAGPGATIRCGRHCGGRFAG